jgi:ubiquinone/menaquinone biosynthesis C-methylase UbiE
MKKQQEKDESGMPPGLHGTVAGRKDDTVTARILAVEFRENDRILEVGCENPDLTVALARRAGYVTGAAVSDDALVVAQKAGLQSGLHNISFQRIEGDRLPYGDNMFDAVVTQGVLHQVADAAKTIQEMVRVVKSPGRLVVADLVGAEDEARREAHAKILAARSGKAVQILAPSALLALCGAEPLEIAAHSQCDERLTFDQWMPAVDFVESARDKVLRMLVAAGKKKTTDLKIDVSGKSPVLQRRWMMVIADKMGHI